jgi:hypothetical protein
MVFEQDGCIYRVINAVYLPHYERLMQSGLYAALTRSAYLVPHRELETTAGGEKSSGLKKSPLSRIPTNGVLNSIGTPLF